jgi:hypothetical protein
VLSNLRIFNKWSFYALLLYFAMQPFNESFHRMVLIGGYFDLSWFAVLSAISLRYIFSGKAILKRSFELKVVLLWMGYLCLHVLLSTIFQGTGSFDKKIYELRFLLQSVPVFILISIRGLNRKELDTLLIIIVLMAPLTILRTYYDYNIASVAEIQDFARSGAGTAYNTFVPYTTFAFFASLYLIFSIRKKIIKFLLVGVSACIIIFIFINPSRQSVAFVIVCGLFYLLKTKSTKKIFIVTLLTLTTIFIINRLNLTDRVTQRFFSEKTFETTRTELMMNGIDSIDGPGVCLIGAGLSKDLSNINPHNNYIYSVMRTGLIGTVLMFLPLFSALIKSVIMSLRYSAAPWFDRNLSTFVTICLLFPLFHSFFGYPHLDPQNAPAMWLGFAIWVVYDRDLHKKALTNRGILQFNHHSDANHSSSRHTKGHRIKSMW